MVLLIAWFELVTLMSLIQETQTDFQDLGKLLLGGVVAAIVVAIAFTFVRMKLRDKKPHTSSFISIAADGENE
jgi:predicted permease